MNPSKIREYYSNEKLLEHILKISPKREVVPNYLNSFGTRPSSLNMPGDFISWVKNGATSFHCSVEQWKNPLLIGKQDLNGLRSSWDLIIDLDSSRDLKHSLMALELLLKALKEHGVVNYGIKFSGNRGFHVLITKDAFPQEIQAKSISKFYPELPKIVINYLRNLIKPRLTEKILNTFSSHYDFDPFSVINVENNWSVRHLFRMPYSLNEKTWLASIPVLEKDLKDFKTIKAIPENVKFATSFIPENEENEAIDLLYEAMDFHSRNKMDLQVSETPEKKEFKAEFEGMISKEFFPRPILKIFEGLEDGRKRALFILIAFFRNLNYGWKQIETEINEWNKKNKEPLSENYIQAQLAWHKRQKQKILPPNYSTDGFYNEILPEEFWKDQKFANPVTEAIVRYKGSKQEYQKDFQKGKTVPAKYGFTCEKCGKKYKQFASYKSHVEGCF